MSKPGPHTEDVNRRDLMLLMTWLSPSFPIGAFAYSHGLEMAIEEGLIADAPSLIDWLTDLVERGSAWNDHVLFALAYRAGIGGDHQTLVETAALATALAGGHERHLETTLLGEAFLSQSVAWHGSATTHLWTSGTAKPYPVAVAALVADHAIGLSDGLTAYLQSSVQTLISVAVRLVPLGQRSGLEVQRQMMEVIENIVSGSEEITMNHLGSATFMSDIMAMMHETLPSRVFRT